MFYDWLSTEHLRADAARRRLAPAGAEHRQSARIRIPGSAVGITPPPTAISWRLTCAVPGTCALAGIDQGIYSSPLWVVRTNVLYAYTRSEGLWRGLDLNAPAGGVRPDAAFANVVEGISDASARQHQLTLGWNIGLPPQPPGNETAKFFVWKRFALYGLRSSRPLATTRTAISACRQAARCPINGDGRRSICRRGSTSTSSASR